MNTRDKHLIDKLRQNKYYAIPTIIRQLVIDECQEELAKYAFTSHAHMVLSRLKEKK